MVWRVNLTGEEAVPVDMDDANEEVGGVLFTFS